MSEREGVGRKKKRKMKGDELRQRNRTKWNKQDNNCM